MFSVEDLQECTGEPWYRESYQICERTLLCRRLGIEPHPTPDTLPLEALRFSQAVLASVSDWLDSLSPDVARLFSNTADIESAFALFAESNNQHDIASIHLLHASVLYDLAGLPSAASSQARRNGLFPSIKAFFGRDTESLWGHLRDTIPDDVYPEETETTPDVDDAPFLAVNQAIGESLNDFGIHLQDLLADGRDDGPNDFALIRALSGSYNTEITTDLISGLHSAIKKRFDNSLLSLLPRYSDLPATLLREIGVPTELWPAQVTALEHGMLNHSVISFGLASPTGTGKTASTRLLLTDFLSQNPGAAALYVVPTRALTAQVAQDLSASLSVSGKQVVSLGAHLTLSDTLASSAQEADVIVFTPEKADLLLRVDPELLSRVGLVIVDEAHHIEQGTRGVLLEFYLWRLRRLLPNSTRIVQLSAVAPNIRELVGWLGPAAQTAFAKVDWRSGRLRLGLFERTKNGRGLVHFDQKAPYEVFGPDECPSNREQNIVELAIRLSKQGVVLLLTTSTSNAEKLANRIAMMRPEVQSPIGATVERLDSRIERELYAECPLRDLVKTRVAYHHSKLPPRVRSALETCIAARDIDIVCATTTLAEGVNFPFSTVIVESLVGYNYELSPRSLWNIAGRAGRFGVDSEGHCILFRPSSWQNRLKQYQLTDYLSNDLDSIPPVRSALAVGISDLADAVEGGNLSVADLEVIEMSTLKIDGRATLLAKRIRGLINVMRVGYTHAGISGLLSLDQNEATEFESDELLAAKQLSGEKKQFAVRLACQQKRVVHNAVSADPELLSVAARVGWSLESQNALLEWLRSREDWQLERFGNLVLGGRIHDGERLSYLLGPLSKSMSEFEGDKLGGFTAYLARGWLEGWPLRQIRSSQTRPIDYARLVEVIYARIQYMLPWALFGCDELLRLEAQQRKIYVGSGVADLSALASEGVPSFDALRLVNFDIERVDATRLAEAYQKVRPATNIVEWLSSLQWDEIAHIVAGVDRRGIDPDLRSIVTEMAASRV